jgi:two-component system, OmpR family, phosphate regulon response regulator PhoB
MARHQGGAAVPVMDITISKAHRERILIVDPDLASAAPLLNKLAQAGFQVTTVDSGEQASAAIDEEDPHLVILDWDLPGSITINLVQRLRRGARGQRSRVIAVSQYGGEQAVVTSLDMGVDDYIVRPYSSSELVARAQALLRPLRAKNGGGQTLEFRELTLLLAECRLVIKDGCRSLRGAEFRLLEYLMRHPERAFSRQTLLLQVWGRESSASERAVDVNVQRLRRTLAPFKCDGYLQTVRNVGYRLSAS